MNKFLRNFKAFTHKRSLKTLFTVYYVFSAMLFVLLLMFFVLNLRRHQEINRYLTEISIVNQQINELEELQLNLFKDPYRYISDREFAKLMIKISDIERRLHELRQNKPLRNNEHIRLALFNLGQYRTLLQEIERVNGQLFGISEGKKALIESILNQIKFSEIYNQPPFSQFSEALLNLYVKLNTGKISLTQFQQELNKLQQELLDLSLEDNSMKLAKHRYSILMKNLNYAVSQYYLLLDRYGQPYKTGLFRQLAQQLDAARLATEAITGDIKQIIHRHQLGIYAHIVAILTMMFILVAVFLTFFNTQFYPEIKSIEGYLHEVSIGRLSPFQPAYSSLELFKITSSINRLMSNLKNRKQIIDKLSQGQYDIEINLLSAIDELGQSLQNLRDKLKQAQIEAQKSKEAEDKQRWITEGMAYLAQKMRAGSRSLDQLFEYSLKGLLEFLGAPMGAFYYRQQEDGEVFYVLKIAYAYNKRRVPKVKYRLTEGFVGTVAAENRTIIISPVPDNYVFYETAFGYGRPDSLMFVPVSTNQEVIGVLEIAYIGQFQQQHIDLAEKFAADFATTIDYVNINEQTRELVKQLQQQTQFFQQKEKDYQKQLEQLSDRIKVLQAQLKDYRDQCRTKEEIIASKVEQIFQLENKLKDKEKEIKEILERFERVEEQYKERVSLLESQIDGLIEEIEKLRKQHKNEQ